MKSRKVFYHETFYLLFFYIFIFWILKFNCKKYKLVFLNIYSIYIYNQESHLFGNYVCFG